MLLPPGLEELIPADHPSRVTGELIGEMDAGYIKLRNYFLGGTKIEAEANKYSFSSRRTSPTMGSGTPTPVLAGMSCASKPRGCRGMYVRLRIITSHFKSLIAGQYYPEFPTQCEERPQGGIRHIHAEP